MVDHLVGRVMFGLVTRLDGWPVALCFILSHGAILYRGHGIPHRASAMRTTTTTTMVDRLSGSVDRLHLAHPLSRRGILLGLCLSRRRRIKLCAGNIGGRVMCHGVERLEQVRCHVVQRVRVNPLVHWSREAPQHLCIGLHAHKRH